jgi:molybdopterin-binding protein
MRISARNQIKGTIKKAEKGATTAHVLVDIGDVDIGGLTDHLIHHQRICR